jgi:hypothetical protein
MVVNLTSEDPYIRDQAEQFICVSCKKFPIPDFHLGKDGVKKDSVRIGQCNHCSGLACWGCWKKNCCKKDPICPKCRFRVDVPPDLHQDPEKETKVEPHMNVLKQKLLLNFLYNQTIIHKCEQREKAAFEKARHLYNEKVQEMKKVVYEQQDQEAELIRKLNNLK